MSVPVSPTPEPREDPAVELLRAIFEAPSPTPGEQAAEERDLLAQSMWEARRILGFDNDGDETPAATIAGGGYEGFARMHEREAAQARQDYDELCDESEGYEKAAAASEAALVVARERLAAVEALCHEAWTFRCAPDLADAIRSIVGTP